MECQRGFVWNGTHKDPVATGAGLEKCQQALNGYTYQTNGQLP